MNENNLLDVISSPFSSPAQIEQAEFTLHKLRNLDVTPVDMVPAEPVGPDMSDNLAGQFNREAYFLTKREEEPQNPEYTVDAEEQFEAENFPETVKAHLAAVA